MIQTWIDTEAHNVAIKRASEEFTQEWLDVVALITNDEGDKLWAGAQ